MKSHEIYIAHMTEAMEKIAAYIAGGESAFESASIIQDAVVRNLEIIGEAAKRVPSHVRDAHPRVPWKRLAGLRDVLIHQYEGVDLGQVWRVASDVLPGILRELRSMSEGGGT